LILGKIIKIVATRCPYFKAKMHHGCMSACVPVCVCLSTSISPKPRQIIVHATCGRGWVFRPWRCDTLCTSGFMDDAIFYTIARNMRRERASTKSGSVAFVPENQFDSFSGSDRTPICDRRAPGSFINDEIYHTKDFVDFHAHCVKAHNCFQATCLTIKCALLPYFYFLSTPKIVRNTALQIRPGFLAHPL